MSTENESNLSWDMLQSFPFGDFSQAFVINNNEFIVAAKKHTHIYKFDIHKNEWIKIFDYNRNCNCSFWSSTYDNKNKLLYGFDRSFPRRILIFDLNTKNKVTSEEQRHKRECQLIFAENQLHQICDHVPFGGTVENGSHWIYDKTKQFKKITSFEHFKDLLFYRLIYLKSKKSIFSFGGFYYGSGFTNSIYEFSCIDSKWKELKIKMPIKLAHIACVTTKNEQYVIILGGMTTECKYSDDIFIYDIRKNIFTKSKIKCPKKGRYHAIMTNNSISDELICFGYVKKCYQMENFMNIQLLPQYLIKIICCYFCNEKIHLLDRGTGKHWKINVDYILFDEILSTF